MPTVKLTIEYDGTAYAGWQRQPDQPTIQAAMEGAVHQITQARIPVIGAGRTDAGVHALGQVASFRTEKALEDVEWKRALNGVLPEDVSILMVELVDDEFHARYSARSKLYEYHILNRTERSALERQRAWHVLKPLDLDAMREAAALLVGRHDFTSFQGSPTDTENPICVVSTVEIQEMDQTGMIGVRVEADRFLKQMVRAMIGTLGEVGLGKRKPQSVKDILEARDRRAAGYTAPAHGLYLVRVQY